MKILTVDIGTGTQDIFLYDSRLDLENGYKLVLPAPTMLVRRQIQQAAARGKDILLQGVTMGGGPSSWAVEDHLRAGLAVFATPEAACTINDDLEAVRELGVKLLSADEAARLPEDVQRVTLRDFDFEAIQAVFNTFGVPLNDLDAAAVCVFDHGAAPPQVSDRKFRFDYLEERLRADRRLSTFAHLAGSQPQSMTRLAAVARAADSLPCPLVLMDSAPAAVLGACFDPLAASRERLMIANVGNFHTLAFRLGPGGVEGVFEHHTGLLDAPKLEALLRALAGGSLTNAAVFGDHGHGALLLEETPLSLDEPDFNLVVTGPRRAVLRGSALRPHFAVPFGDMMIAGCFGLLSACADRLPHLAEPIRASLAGAGGAGRAPWEV